MKPFTAKLLAFALPFSILLAGIAPSRADEVESIEETQESLDELLVKMSGKQTVSTRLFSDFLRVGPQYSYFSYKEPGVMSTTGHFFGISGALTGYDESRFWRGQLELEFSAGSISYEGGVTSHSADGTSSSRPATASGRDSTYEGRATVGFNRFPNSRMMTTPFAGFGYRRLHDRIEGEGSYGREVTYLFLPLGFDFTRTVGETSLLTARLEFDLFLGGTVKSRLSEVDSQFEDLEHRQSSGRGFRGSVAYAFEAGGSKYRVEPYVRYWSIDDSDVADLRIPQIRRTLQTIEPENSTTTSGLNLSVSL